CASPPPTRARNGQCPQARRALSSSRSSPPATSSWPGCSAGQPRWSGRRSPSGDASGVAVPDQLDLVEGGVGEVERRQVLDGVEVLEDLLGRGRTVPRPPALGDTDED